jgi:hypothetical protein
LRRRHSNEASSSPAGPVLIFLRADITLANSIISLSFDTNSRNCPVGFPIRPQKRRPGSFRCSPCDKWSSFVTQDTIHTRQQIGRSIRKPVIGPAARSPPRFSIAPAAHAQAPWRARNAKILCFNRHPRLPISYVIASISRPGKTGKRLFRG